MERAFESLEVFQSEFRE